MHTEAYLKTIMLFFCSPPQQKTSLHGLFSEGKERVGKKGQTKEIIEGLRSYKQFLSNPNLSEFFKYLTND